MDKLTEVLERMAELMEQISGRVESLVEGQDKLIEEQRLMGLGLEVLIRVIVRGHSSKLSFPKNHTPSHTPSHIPSHIPSVTFSNTPYIPPHHRQLHPC